MTFRPSLYFDLGLIKLYVNPSNSEHIPLREDWERVGPRTPQYSNANVWFERSESTLKILSMSLLTCVSSTSPVVHSCIRCLANISNDCIGLTNADSCHDVLMSWQTSLPAPHLEPHLHTKTGADNQFRRQRVNSPSQTLAGSFFCISRVPGSYRGKGLCWNISLTQRECEWEEGLCNKSTPILKCWYVTLSSQYLRACLLSSVRYREYYWIDLKGNFLFFLLKSTGLYILISMGKTFPKHHQLTDQKGVIGKITGKTLHMGKQWRK